MRKKLALEMALTGWTASRGRPASTATTKAALVLTMPGLKTAVASASSATAEKPYATLCGFAFVCLAMAWLSNVSVVASVFLLTATIALVALLLPSHGIFLLLLFTPIQEIFSLEKGNTQIVIGGGLLAVAVRHGYLFRNLAKRTPPAIVALSLVALLAALKQLPTLNGFAIGELVGAARYSLFYVCLGGLALACYHHTARGNPFANGVVFSLLLSVGFTIAVDAIATYAPRLDDAINLIRHFQEPYNFRFAGLHPNPNATSKFLLFAVLFCASTLWTLPATDQIKLRVLSFVLLLFALNATSSKAALVGAVGSLSCLAVLCIATKAWKRLGVVTSVLVLSAGITAVWLSSASPILSKFASEQWAQVDHRSNAEAKAADENTSLMERFERDLRISESYTMRAEVTSRQTTIRKSEVFRDVPGQIIYEKRDCRWTCMGQRDLIWKVGISIVKDYWLIGMWSTDWRHEYQSRLGFPFDSPHNAALEAWGDYGLAGLAIYLYLAYLLVASSLRSFRAEKNSRHIFLLHAISLYVIATLIIELLDPAKFLSQSPHTIWLWSLISIQSKLLVLNSGQVPMEAVLSKETPD